MVAVGVTWLDLTRFEHYVWFSFVGAVAELNPRARAFYRRNGFAADGTRKVGSFLGEDLAEIRMVR